MDPKIQLRSHRRSIPAQAGIGLRSPHHEVILSQRPAVGWLEAYSENFFSPGGTHIDQLERLRAHYPLSLHGVGLSLGSTDPIDRIHLNNLKRVVARFEPELVSEHLSWSSVEGRFANDLLPVWALYAAAIQRLGDIPTLIEWDSELPSVEVRAAEAQRADRVRLLALRLSGEHRVA
jgi:uncharacterized protein (UPF0276 family)